MVKKKQPKVKGPESWSVLEQVLEAAPLINKHILIYGRSGTGKSHAARHVGVANDEVVAVTLTEETGAFELRGTDRLVEGSFQFGPGPGLLAWSRGGRLVLEEIDKTSGDAMTFLLGILDDAAFASHVLPDGTTVRPAEGFHCVATANCEDPDELPEALRDRFTIRVRIDRPHPDAIASLPADLQRAAANSAACFEAERRHSIRAWQAFDALRGLVGRDVAAVAVFGDASRDVLNALEIAET